MLYAIVGMLVIIADQWVKYWVSINISTKSVGESFIPGIISLVNVHNDGAAFGIFSGSGARIYFIILTGAFTLAVILALATNFISGRMGRWSIVMMTAGGLSNCLDRVINGFVQDMFKVEFFNFPVFNIADIFITVFCLLFVFSIMFGRKEPDYDDEFDEEDDEEEDRPRREKKEKEPKPEKKARKTKKAKYEEDYEQYKVSRAARQPAEPQPQPKQVPAYNSADPFAEWEKANAKANQPKTAALQAPQAPVQPARPVQQVPAQPPRPVQQPAVRPAPQAPAQQPAARKSSDMDFDLDDILNEFK